MWERVKKKIQNTVSLDRTIKSSTKYVASYGIYTILKHTVSTVYRLCM